MTDQPPMLRATPRSVKRLFAATAAMIGLAAGSAQALGDHDAFALPFDLRNGVTVVGGGFTHLATTEPGEPGVAEGIRHTLWWKWTAPDDGRLSVAVGGTSFGSWSARVFTGTSLTALNDLSGGAPLTNTVEVPVYDGQLYYIQTGSVGGTPTIPGEFDLDMEFIRGPLEPLPPLYSGPTGGSGGLPPGVHEVFLAGRPARIIVGAGYDESKPTHLAYYLHGDEGGYTFHTSTPSTALRRLIDEHGLIYVAPLAPRAGEAYPWSGGGVNSMQGNAEQIQIVLDHMFAHYNVHRDRVLGAGGSGGSWFHDAVFFPFYGSSYPSYFNLNCGAAGMGTDLFSYGTALTLGTVASAVDHSELKYTIGTNDFLYDEAVESAATYEGFGFTVLTEYLPGVGHCAYDVGAEVASYWEEKLLQFENASAGLDLSIDQDHADRKPRLRWQSQVGKTYTVQQTGTLQNNSSWTNVTTIAGTGGTLTHLIDPAPPLRQFYRIVAH